LAAAGRQAQARAFFAQRAAWHRFRDALDNAFSLRPELRRITTADTVVCRCEDVRRGALVPFADWRAAKLHTRCGMGPCQGRTCGAAADFLFGWDNNSVRPPLFPVNVGALTSADTTTNNNATSTPSQPRV
jgi:NADPH-dependent 2,4-dienoyl-CoA reductase/sulfur reductase-like enzyme